MSRPRIDVSKRHTRVNDVSTHFASFLGGPGLPDPTYRRNPFDTERCHENRLKHRETE